MSVNKFCLVFEERVKISEEDETYKIGVIVKINHLMQNL